MGLEINSNTLDKCYQIYYLTLYQNVLQNSQKLLFYLRINWFYTALCINPVFQLMKIISPARSENYDISNELEIELSVIESGLVVAKVESSIAFIIKDSGKMVERLSGLRSALLNFKRISRPEFPTINVELRLKTVCGLSVKYGYFF